MAWENSAGPVGGPHQRPGHHAREPECLRLLAQFHELFGLDPALHRVVPRGRPQVLGDGQQVTAGRAQVLHGLGDFAPLLAQPEDQVGLGDQPGVASRTQHVERTRVPEAGPDPPEDPRHGLDVVREDLRPGTEDLRQPVRFGVEVGNEQFHSAAGDGGVDLAADLRVQPGAAVGQVVTRDAGHGRVLQAHSGDGLRDPARLALVKRQRLARVDLAEVTPPGALVAADQEGRLAVLPAFEDVRAAGLLAHRVQAFAADERFQFGVGRSGAQPGLDPRRLPLDRDLAVAGLEAEHAPAFGCEYHPSRVCRRGRTAVRGHG